MNVETFYEKVPARQRDPLRQFRIAHPAKTIYVDDTPWTYLVSGMGTQPLLWLVGGLRVADAAYASIPLLEDAFHIITPDYAAVDSMAALCDGLAEILDAEGITRAHVLSGSFGGMVAQAFVRRHPQRVDRLILSTTTPPNEAARDKYQEQLKFIEMTPDALVREESKRIFYDIIAPAETERKFWEAYLNELFSTRLGKADILSTYRCMVDFMNSRYTHDDLKNWNGRLLLIDSDTDATFPPEVQQELRRLYPAAQVHTFVGAGHSPGSTQRQAYFTLVREFLS
jgi:3-oxoadipate enol-lactonase